MAGERGIRAGRAFVELTADSSGLQRSLRQASARLRAFGSGLRSVGVATAAIGAVGLAPFLASLRSLTTAGDEIDKVSQRAGAAADEFQKLRFALEQSGAQGTTAEQAFRGLARFALAVEQGSSSATDALNRLGLTADDLRNKSTSALLNDILNAAIRINDPRLQGGVLQTVLGRAGQALIPLLNAGEDALKGFADQFDRLNLGASDQTIRRAAQFTDAVNLVRTAVRSLTLTLGASLSPTLEKLAEPLAQVTAGFKNLVESNGQTVSAIGAISAGLVGLGLAATAAGVAVGALATLAVGLASGGALATGVAVTAAAIPAIVGGVVAAGAALAIVERRTGAISTAFQTIGFQVRGLAPNIRAGFGALFDALATDTTAFAELISLAFEEGLAKAAQRTGTAGGVLASLLGLDASLEASVARQAAIRTVRGLIESAVRDSAGAIGGAGVGAGVLDTVSRINRGSFSGDSRQFGSRSDAILRDQLITQRRQQATLERIEENTRPGNGGLGVFAP